VIDLMEALKASLGAKNKNAAPANRTAENQTPPTGGVPARKPARRAAASPNAADETKPEAKGEGRRRAAKH
jgi:hypothetical protein